MNAAAQSPPGIPGGKCGAVREVLIVDDDPVLRTMLERLLLREGVETVRVAADGRIAESIYRRHAGSIDTISLDINMPECDGIEFIRLLARDRFGGRLVLVTGASRSIRNSALLFASDLGIRQVFLVEKPFDWEDVVATILGTEVPARA